MAANASTAAAARTAFEAQGLTGPALTLAVQSGAAERHKARVATASAAAETASRAPGGDPGSAPLLEALLLRSEAESLTPGGMGDASGKRSQRATWAAALGTGRRQAGDGGAWDAAIREASGHALAGRRLVIAPGDGPGTLTLRADDYKDHVLDVQAVADAFGRGERAWREVRALFGGLLLHALASADRGYPSQRSLRWEGPVEALGYLLNAASDALEEWRLVNRLLGDGCGDHRPASPPPVVEAAEEAARAWGRGEVTMPEAKALVAKANEALHSAS